MEKISITKLEKEFNSNNDFNIESIIDLNNTKDNGKTVRKLLSNFSNYDDLVNESDKRISKDTEYVESLSSVEKLSRELELKYLDKYILKQVIEMFLMGVFVFTAIIFASDTFITLIKQISM